ncbi:MAG TPA: transcriptional repressor LexA [Spirochaetales bacterium]|nr:transcriptional repressor LexA [Spirochaetales bacterium]
MKDLTERQKAVLEFLTKFIQENSYPPTVRETAKAFNISIKGAYDHIKALERKGYIKLQENRSRAMEIVDRREESEEDLSCVLEVPILGDIAAGNPIFAEENWVGTVRVPTDLVHAKNCFALKVQGDSMKNAGIRSGDIAIIEQKPVAENGDIVAALIEDSATLKRFFKENNRIKLQAENPDYAPIYTQDVRILGKLKAIIRNY